MHQRLRDFEARESVLEAHVVYGAGALGVKLTEALDNVFGYEAFLEEEVM